MLVNAPDGREALEGALRRAPQPAGQVLVLARDVLRRRWLLVANAPRLSMQYCSFLMIYAFGSRFWCLCPGFTGKRQHVVCAGMHIDALPPLISGLKLSRGATVAYKLQD
jgi:hypothetical protein